MSSEVDLNLISLKADEMYNKTRPGFVHASHQKQTGEGWTELTFPSGLVCTTNSSRIETELMYNEIFVAREYLRSGIELRDHDTIVDVGANVGMFTMYLLANIGGPTVHAIEPVPETFEVLRQNAARYPAADVRAYNTALGSIAHSSLDIVFFPLLTGNSTAYPEIKQAQRNALATVFTAGELAHIYSERRMKVPSTTLSSIIRENSIDRIDLLKVDTEGSELNILTGIEATHWGMIRQVAMEVHDEKTVLPKVLGLLSANGMTSTIDDASRDAFGSVVITGKRR